MPLPAVMEIDPACSEWLSEITDLLDAGLLLALAAPSQLPRSYLLSALARRGISTGGPTIGMLRPFAVNSSSLLDIVENAPGILVAPLSFLQMGEDAYSMAERSNALLEALSSIRRPIIFTGAVEEFQAVFGGHGGKSDPMHPVLMHAPEVPAASLLRYAVEAEARRQEVLSAAARSELQREITDETVGLTREDFERIIPAVVTREVRIKGPGRIRERDTRRFIDSLRERRETAAAGSLMKRPKDGNRDLRRKMADSFMDP